jgi:outer membrane receptor protein involved in Fe transport
MDPRWNGRDEHQYLFPTRLPAIAALLLAALLAAPRLALAAPGVEFHVPAGDAARTLNEFSRQANLQLLFDYNVVQGRLTQAVEGWYEPRDALRRMLGETGLTFTLVNERTLAVTPLRSASSSPPHARTRPKQSNSQTATPAGLQADAALETVHVTGTNLRGAAPVGANVLAFDRQAIDQSAAPTISDFLATLPQVFGGGPTQDTHLGTEAQTNSGLGTGVNLRGLGAGATLVLMNSRRIAPSGTEGIFVDIDNIPLSAIERVDVLADSASALYGADAVGGVINLIMRDNFTGAETLVSSGIGTHSTLRNYLLSQTVGHKWDDGTAMLSVEFYRRDALPANERDYTMSDLTPLGGGDFDTRFANPGNILLGQTNYAIPKGQDGAHLTASSLIPGTENLQNKYLATDIIPAQKRWSLYTSGRESFGDQVSVFANLLLADREATERTGGAPGIFPVPAGNPFYPAGLPQPALVYYNFGPDLGTNVTGSVVKTANMTVGANVDLGNWRLELYGGYAREKEDQTQTGMLNAAALQAALADTDPATAFNPFGDGSHTNPETLAGLVAPFRYRMDSQLQTLDVAADGPVARLPGGAVKLAVGVDRRVQLYASDTPPLLPFPESSIHLSRQTTSAFTEIVVPVFGKDNALPGLQKLDLSAAARYEDYSTFGHATTPKLGLRWAPLASVALRSTWSRALQAPPLTELDESHNVVVPEVLADPRSPTGQTVALIWSGNNAGLREERANSWTVGLDLKPQALPGLSMGLTLFDIAFKDRIENPIFSTDILTNPRYSGLVTFNPDPALISSVCSHALFAAGPQGTCTALGAGALVDVRAHNAETLATRGIDFNLEYERPVRYGTMTLTADGTYLTKFVLAEGNGSPETSLLNTQNYPLNLRLRTSLSWSGRRLGATLTVNYSNSYRDTASVPNLPVAAWTTIDAQIRYQLGNGAGGLLDHTRLELSALNLFNRDPPFLNNALAGLGYDQENADPYGRIVSLWIRKDW